MSDLQRAAQAVLDRWDSPNWEWLEKGPTAVLMANLRNALHPEPPVAWMVYTEDGESVYVTDNPADIKPSQRALPLFTTAQQTKPGDNK